LRFLDRLPIFLAALWWGSLSAVGLLVVPLLFVHLPTPAVAGAMAARLFSAQTWVALGCGVLLLMCARGREAPRMGWAQGALLFVVGGMLLALLLEYGAAPRIQARTDLRLWHSIGSAMLALQWLCAGVVLWKVSGARPDPASAEPPLLD
jgi:hypothetical protein